MSETRWARQKRLERWTGRRVAECSEAEISLARAAGYEPGRVEAGEGAEAYFVGRDPRKMSGSELLGMGHEQMSALEAIRAKCLDCCAGSPHEVRLCVATTCPSWPFRMGKSPWRAKLSEEQLEAARERGRMLAAAIRR